MVINAARRFPCQRRARAAAFCTPCQIAPYRTLRLLE